MLQRQPACAQSREQGLGEHFPQGPRSWFFLHNSPFPTNKAAFSRWPVYIHTVPSIHGAAENQLFLTAQGLFPVLLVCHFHSNWAPQERWLQQPLPEAQGKNTSFAALPTLIMEQQQPQVWVWLIVLQLNVMKNFPCYRVTLRCLVYNLHYLTFATLYKFLMTLKNTV